MFCCSISRWMRSDSSDWRRNGRRPAKRALAGALLELAKQEGAASSRCFSAPRPASARPTPCWRRRSALKAEGTRCRRRPRRDAWPGRDRGTARRPGGAAAQAGRLSRPQLMEFDLDAALARRPELIIVDELAHTNAPDSRHPKRYQDVEELLDAGIDVWTALNIQHLESLSDVVSRITGVTVRETVPDKVIEQADEIVVVDITPDELIQRLKEGKVYLPDNARRAADNFFKPGNLTALRELALRRTADRVDDQMVELSAAARHRRPVADGRAHPGLRRPRSAFASRGEGRQPSGERAQCRLDRGARRTDRARNCDDAGGSSASTRRLQLASGSAPTRRGSPARDLPAKSCAMRGAKTSRRSCSAARGGLAAGDSWADRSRRSSSRQAHGIAIHVVTPRRTTKHRRSTGREPCARIAALGLLAAPVAVAAGGPAWQARRALAALSPSISMIFLLAVLLCAVSFGVWPARSRGVLSFFAYNFFFIEPVYTFTVASPHELLALIVFLLVADPHRRAWRGACANSSDAAQRRIRQTQMLFDFSRKLSGTAEPRRRAVGGRLADGRRDQGPDASCSSPRMAVILHHGGFPPEDTMGPSDWAAARWALNSARRPGSDDDAAQRPVSLPAAADVRAVRRRDRREAGEDGLTGEDERMRRRRCSTRRRSPSSARCSSGCGRGAGRGGERAAALGAAVLDLARPADAARLDPRLGDQPAQPGRQDAEGGTRRSARGDRGGDGAAFAFRHQSARHDAAGNRRARSQARLGRSRRCRARRRGTCAKGLAGPPDRALDRPRTAAWSRAMRRCSNRSCSICSTTPTNTPAGTTVEVGLSTGSRRSRSDRQR